MSDSRDRLRRRVARRRSGRSVLVPACVLACSLASALPATRGEAAPPGVPSPPAAAAAATPAASSAAESASDRIARGGAMQQRVYDAKMPADDPWLQMSQDQVFAQIWTRPGLTLRDRRLISLTAAAYAASPAGYISHIEGALDHGDLTPAELWEWLIHFTNYAGYPKAAPVWAEIRIALAKRGVLPLPANLGPGRDPELDRKRSAPVDRGPGR